MMGLVIVEETPESALSLAKRQEATTRKRVLTKNQPC